MDNIEKKPSVEGNSCSTEGSAVDGLPVNLISAPTKRMPHLHKLDCGSGEQPWLMEVNEFALLEIGDFEWEFKSLYCLFMKYVGVSKEKY